ncbi:glycosyltransferase involved in cell wall biosynthesis [Flavobacterium chryseum]|uniref:glycosyltransferase family 2 protein n=1 Tax=Flavobacterium sp. P3160 TaxID=2512113 RepID=UPI00105C31FF|nr:glycosyltransferase family 2 protein [Flavobacterium sp. P3160]TDO77463.1 glycosyltransferase involved in cell wall biosynthesis [Flavobacterium sp. P3160]
MSNQLISIIIPTYNRANLIRETLTSVLEQTYKNWECIIIDDGSTDDTEIVINEYVKKDNRFKYYHRPNEKQKGANSCRNYGFELSRGEYINWFDDDDIMLNNFLEEKIKLFTSEIDLVICSGVYVDDNLNKIKVIDLKSYSFLFKDYVLWKLHIITNSIMFRKSFLNDKELFSLKISRGQETELFSRLFYKLPEKKYLITNIPLFLYRQHLGTKTYRNNSYVKSYKESQAIIAIENLKKSIELHDSELIKSYYFNLVDFFYRSLEQKHFENCRFIVKNSTPQLFLINKKLAVKFWISSCFFILAKRGSYKFEKYFKNFSL